jgi:D-apionolactonase
MTPRYEPLVAGPLRASWDPFNGQLRWIMWGDREIVRGIYGAVRDQFWGTVEPSLSDVQIERGGDSFRVSFTARTSATEVDFEWAGAIVGNADGTISYTFSGRALGEFLRQRIGLCVLHPIRECRGQSCRIIHTDGAIEAAAFPSEVSPHQPIKDIAAIAQEFPDSRTVIIEFEGEAFETEDQRNWTDASYKTYCIPLDRPRPVLVRPGDVVRQAVVVRLAGASRNVPRTDDQLVPLKLGAAVIPPRLGFELTEDLQDERLIQRLKSLRPDHLRVTFDPDSKRLGDEVRAAADLARAAGARLHAVVAMGADSDDQFQRLAFLVEELHPPVAAWLVFQRDECSTSARLVEHARRHLARLSPGSMFGGGTDQNFAELNRDRRPRAGFDVVSFPVNPQVHAFDDDSIAETLEVQGDVIATARTFLGPVPIVAGPIVLSPRFTPDGQRHVAVDKRLDTPFSAAWALGSVAALAAAGCEFATYFEVSGPRGLFNRINGEATKTSPAAVLFENLAELRDAEWSRVDCAVRTSLVGLAYRTKQVSGVLLANPGREPVRVWLPFEVELRRPLDSDGGWEPAAGRDIVVPPHRSIRLEGQPS